MTTKGHVKMTTKGHVGVSWWEKSPGVWQVAASALGCASHSIELQTDDQLEVELKAKELLDLAMQDITHTK